MSDREPRQNWGTEGHRDDVGKFKTAVAIGTLFLFAIPMIVWTDGLAQMFGVGLGSVAVWRLFPDSHGQVSDIVDRLPFLRSKPKSKEIEE